MNEETSRFHERVSALLADALELPEAERAAHVRAAAGGDAALEREVLSLLGWTDDEELDVALPAAEPEPLVVVNEVPGYRVIRVIGEGGMGTVYEAEQLEPNRRVALKVIRGFSSSPEALRRFRREADLLARLHHPGICQVHEVGRTAGGLPFLSMELIDGRPLTRFAEEEELGRAERLALICRVCEAVAHAHERGIVHRDLKPENVLVTPDGRPKVVDFGIARATQPSQASTLLTGTGSILGTLSYMSPEQAAGERGVDHRADVFSLGVMAFELLTGRLPMELGELSFPQALYQIQQADLSMAGRGEPTLRGDLETILGKALEREPERRYPTAEAMAADVRRHLEHEPIVARRPSLGYRARKFTRRHRTMVLMTGLLVATLSAASVVSLRQAQLAGRRAEEAERQAHRAVVTAAFSAVDEGRMLRAAEQLQRIEPKRGGWEAELLEALVRHALGRPLLEGPIRGLVVSQDGRRAFTFREGAGGVELVAVDLADGRITGAWPLDGARLVVPEEALRLAVRDRLERSPEPFEVLAEGGRAPRWVRPCGWGTVEAVLDVSSGLDRASVRADGASVTRLCDLASGRWLTTAGAPSLGNTIFAPGGRSYAVLGISQLHVGDGRTGELLWSAPERRDAYRSGVFAPDGRFLYTGGSSSEPELQRWDLERGEAVRSLRIEAGEGYLQAMDPSGEWLLYRDDETIRIFDAELTGEHARRWMPPGGSGYALPAQGDRLFALSADRELRAWELDEPSPRRRWKAHDSYAYAADFSPDGRRLLSGGWDAVGRVWDFASGEELTVLRPAGEHRVTGACFTRDGRRAVLTAGSLSLHDASTGERLRKRSVGSALSVLADPARDRVLVAGHGGLVELDDRSLETIRERPGASAPAFDPSGRRLALVEQGRLVVLDAATWEPLWSAEGSPDGGYGLPAWDAEGRLLAATSGVGHFEVFDARDGRSLRRPPCTYRPWCLAWAAGGDRLLTGGTDGTLRVWDARTGELLVVLTGQDSYIKALALSPDRRVVVSASGDGTLQAWDSRPAAERSAGRPDRPASEGR